MPQRSNEFQELVGLVQRALAPDDAVVRESVLVEVDGEAETREIDVLIETKVGEYRIKIAVEAKDEGRPMDSTKFESIMGKYLVEGGVKVNKIVIVTHRGFYKPVIVRAKKLEVDLVTLKEARSVDWSEFRPPGPCFKTRPRICDVRITPKISAIPPAKLLQDGRILCSCGRHHGTPQQYAEFLIWKIVAQRERDVLLKLDDEAAEKGEEKRANVEISPGPGHEPQLTVDQQCFPFETISFDVLCEPVDAPMPLVAPHLQFSLAPHVCSVEVVPPILDEDPALVRQEGRVICTCCGKDYGTVAEWAHDRTMRRFLVTNKQAQEMLSEGVRKSPSGHAHLEMSWPLCKHLRIRYKGQVHNADHIAVKVHAAYGAGKLECKQYDLAFANGDVKRVSHMQATLAGKKVTFVMPEGIRSKHIALRVDNAEARESADKKARLLKTRAKLDKRKNREKP
ncbi:MAG: hypothetical protein IT422_02095 [Pirellulaceae bacterium]|nr:hypothetical protein [Pirellulaceae bacterium]